MDHVASSSQSLKALAVKWQALALYLVACMRALRWMEDAGSGRALKRAVTVEACLHTALYEITRDIEAAAALPNAAGREGKAHLDYLRLVQRLIAAMIMILQHIKLRLIINHAPPVWPVAEAAELALLVPNLPRSRPQHPP